VNARSVPKDNGKHEAAGERGDSDGSSVLPLQVRRGLDQAGHHEYQQQPLAGPDRAGLQLPEDQQAENNQADPEFGHHLAGHDSPVRCSSPNRWPGRHHEQQHSCST
jgi:hypothetical protein